MRYYEVFISAEDQQQADKIMNSLLEKKLVTGGQFIKAPARFLWKGQVENMEYLTITALTSDKFKQAIIDDVESSSDEEVPMIRFATIEVNKKLANWVDQTLEE